MFFLVHQCSPTERTTTLFSLITVFRCKLLLYCIPVKIYRWLGSCHPWGIGEDQLLKKNAIFCCKSTNILLILEQQQKWRTFWISQLSQIPQGWQLHTHLDILYGCHTIIVWKEKNVIREIKVWRKIMFVYRTSTRKDYKNKTKIDNYSRSTEVSKSYFSWVFNCFSLLFRIFHM